MTRLLRQTLRMLLTMTLMTGVAYPLAVTGIARLLFADAANGSLVERDGKIVGSRLIGQAFSDPKYFWPRPSATSPAYATFPSGASNLGPNHPALAAAVRTRIAVLRAADPDAGAAVPIDLVTASGSGLDPHITPAAALYQLPRVARARELGEDTVRSLVERATEGRQLDVLGEPGVNVLKLNLLLDEQG